MSLVVGVGAVTDPKRATVFPVAPIEVVTPVPVVLILVVPVTARPPDEIVCVLVKVFVELSFA